MTSLDDVKSLISKHKGFQDTNRFRVILPSVHYGDDIVAMNAFCREVDFPGRILDTIQRRTYHKAVYIPVGYTNDSVNMTFTETRNNIVSRYLDHWMSTVVSPFDGLTAYRDDIARDIFIMREDREGKITYAVLLKKAWPKNKSKVTMTDNSMDEFVTQSIEFEYEDFLVVDHTLTGSVNRIIESTRTNILGLPLKTIVDTVRGSI